MTISPTSRLLETSGLLLALGTVQVMGAVSFVFDYGSGSDGFNDSTLGADRRNALESAAATLGSWFNHTATIEITASSFNDGGDATLAYAGSSFSVYSGFRGYLTGIVGQKIMSNGATDANGIDADGEITVNFGHSWDLDDSVDASSYDFKSTVMHEMLHAVGFASGINADGTDIWGAETPSESTPGGGANGGIWSPFDDFLVDVDGNAIINDTEFHLDLVNWTMDSVGGSAPAGGLFFDGPNTRAANGGDPAGLHTPTTFSSGSSVSHLDASLAAFDDLLMTASSQTGPGTRTLSEIEKGVLRDIGYSIIPEPSGVSLLLLSTTLLLRRRRPSHGQFHP